MATQRLESGQMQLRSVGGVPMVQPQQQQVDFVGPRVAAQGANQLAQVLDRMSASAFQLAAPMRQAEGFQYVADNKLTDEQIQKAKDGVPLGFGSTSSLNFFDQAVAKARSLELSGHFEIEGRNELTKLLADVKDGRASSEQVSTKIKTMTDGYSKSLSNIDPEASIKFRATMATHGHTVLNAAYTAELERAKAQRFAKFDADFDNGVRLLEETISQGNWTDSMGQQRSVDELADVFRKNVLTQSLLLGDKGLQKEYSTKFESALINAKIGVVSKHVVDTAFAPDSMSAIAKLDRGDAGKMSPIWNTLNFADQAKVRSNLRTTQIERQTTKDQSEKDILQGDTVRVAQLQNDYFTTGSSAALKELRVISIRSPKAISPESVFDMPNKRAAGELANPRAEFVLKTEIMNGMHPNPASIEQRSKELGIGYKQLSSTILPFFITRGNEEERDIEKLFRTESKIVPGQFNISQKQNSAYAQLTGRFSKEYLVELDKAQKEGKPVPSKLEVAQKVITKRQSSEQTKAITKNIELLNSEYGMQGSTRKTGIVFSEESDYNDIASQAKKLGLKTEDLNSIQQRLQIIQQQRQALDAQ
jgi:hypothetical protein